VLLFRSSPFRLDPKGNLPFERSLLESSLFFFRFLFFFFFSSPCIDFFLFFSSYHYGATIEIDEFQPRGLEIGVFREERLLILFTLLPLVYDVLTYFYDITDSTRREARTH